jgi:CII-binding regulator of phage lambda lysogenization HflD
MIFSNCVFNEREEFMMRMVVLAGLMFVFSLAGTGFARVDGALDVETLMNGLRSGSGAHRIQIAKVITESGIEDQALYEQIAALLQAGYPVAAKSEQVDEMSWLCKALAASGNLRYKTLLEEISDKAPSMKLQHYADQSAEMIEEYAERMQIMNATETWDEDLSVEENRLVNMLNSDKLRLKMDAAKTIVRSIGVDEKVFEALASELSNMVAAGRSGFVEIDTMSWMCKALAVSGNPKYAQTLQQVHDDTGSFKLKGYANTALKQLQ